MILSSWGKNIKVNSDLQEVFVDITDLKKTNLDGFIPRGNARSYGDSSLNKNICKYSPRQDVIQLNKNILTVSSNILLHKILDYIVPKGYFLPVLPGTSFVSIGGAVASDIHGKNAHNHGNISSFIEELVIFNGSKIVTASRTENVDLFHATLGGMGLTGLILTIKIKLINIKSNLIEQIITRYKNLDNLLDHLVNDSSEYSVGWMDISSGKFKRGVIFSGNHSQSAASESSSLIFKLRIPKIFPGMFINKFSISLFNKVYFFINKDKKELVHYKKFFFPLDSLLNWNNLYGDKGLVQFQPIFKYGVAKTAFYEILEYIYTNNLNPTLCVIKNHKLINSNFLSFSDNGFSFAIDFKNVDGISAHFKKLFLIVNKYDGKIYLTKDSFLKKNDFQIMYPKWEQFNEIRKIFDCDKFKSLQSKRLGLDG